MIELLTACTANMFIGTEGSTFSHYIMILRGFLSNYFQEINGTPYFLQPDGYKNNIKNTKEWNCDKGCWNLLNPERWTKLESVENLPISNN